MLKRLHDINGKDIHHKDFVEEIKERYANRYFDIGDVNYDKESDYKVITAKTLIEILAENPVIVAKLKNSYYIEIRFPYSTDFTLYKVTIKDKNYTPKVIQEEEEIELNNKEFIKELVCLNKDILLKCNADTIKINSLLLGKLLDKNVDFAVKEKDGYYVKLNNNTIFTIGECAEDE